MTNMFAPTYRSLESSNYFFRSYMTNGRQRVKVVLILPNSLICKSIVSLFKSILLLLICDIL